MGSAAFVARRLGAQREEDQWRCSCPLCGDYDMLLAQGEVQPVIVHCIGGCDPNDLLSVLVGFGLLDDDDGDEFDESPVVRERTSEERRLRIDGERWFYQHQTTDDMLWLHRYLHSRGIDLSSPVLRFCPKAPHRSGVHLPAMVAPVVAPDGEQIGNHLTYLRRDGYGKAQLGNPEYQRECRGEVRGGVVRLAAHDPESELIIGEGIETTLSAMQLMALPGWAAVYAGNLKNTLELPEAVKRICIAADNDFAGIYAAIAAQKRWAAQGRAVRVVMPATADMDFNDVLQGGCGQ